MLCPLSIVDDSDTTHVQPAVLVVGVEKRYLPLFVVFIAVAQNCLVRTVT